MIVALEPGIVRVQCPACKTTRAIATTAFQLGVENDPNVVSMPPCPCGKSRQFFNRTFDKIDAARAGTTFDLRRRMVNTLCEELRRTGRVHPQHVDAVSRMGTPADLYQP